MSSRLFLFLSVLLAALPAAAEDVLVAVASNFLGPMERLREEFQRSHDHQLRIASGSTGKLYAQIRNGAPYEAFLSADQSTVERLVDESQANGDSRFTYAVGRLVLWSSREGLELSAGFLEEGAYDRLAISNPRLAPYGLAAQETLQSLGLWTALQRKLVRGENIGQTFQFVRSGNAPLGLVALSQLGAEQGSRWLVPERLHGPIRQDAVALRAGKDSGAVREFLDFLQSAQARAIIESFGYRLPKTEL